MFFEAPSSHPVSIVADKAVFAESAEAPAPPLDHPPATPEQIRAAEALFSAREQENQQVAALLGLWTGMAILSDLTTETFTEPAGEVEPQLKKPKDPNEEE